MKERIEELLRQAIESLKTAGELGHNVAADIRVERARDARHGDFASNIALGLAKQAGRRPRELAEAIAACVLEDALLEKIEVAGPGFINFFLRPQNQWAVVRQIHESGTGYGRSDFGAAKKVQVEFVSANPTGPLHVGHGRGAAYGAVTANLLEAVGFKVQREYYVNDTGRQMDILAVSIWLRYLEECGEVLCFPENGYRGEYIRDIAWSLHRQLGEAHRRSAEQVTAALPPDAAEGGDREKHIDALIERMKALLPAEHFDTVLQAGLSGILADIRDDLGEFGIHYDEWFSERGLLETGAIDKALATLRRGGHLYEKDGAVWFASKVLGDEKDRVVVRENGQTTYFASDIAYHWNKLQRGFDRLIDIWGADHHGYVPRVRAAVQALGGDAGRLEVRLVQFVVLYRGLEKVQMSTRKGEFVTLRQLRNEVGKDAARFFYVMRKSEQHLDFDLELARSQSSDNPVYYVQYAHARVCSVLRQLDEKNQARDIVRGMEHLFLLGNVEEQALMRTLAQYPEIVLRSALQYEPHHIAHYLRELANEFHVYYNAHQFLVADADLRDARLNLIGAVRQVLANGLGLLGVFAPESM